MNKILIIKDSVEKAMAAETNRAIRLIGKAENCTAAAIAITGFQLLNASNVLESDSPWAERAFYSALGILVVSLFFGVYSMGSKAYADYPRGDKLWEILKPENVSPEAAEEAIIQLLLKSREQNAKLNDAKARSVSRGTWLLLAGFLLVIASQLLTPLAVISPPPE